MIPPESRRAINEEQVRRFLEKWDPTWRWVLILGLRDMRANLPRLGQIASNEVHNDTWAEEEFVFGPLALGITATAVNEAVQHCEDLFALLTFLRDGESFARRMASYGAGRVVGLADKLVKDSDATLAARFCVPPLHLLEAGLAKAENREAALSQVRDGIDRLGDLVREVVTFYKTYAFFHVQYKHGLKIPLRPFGIPTPETIEQRKTDVTAPLFALSNERISEVLKRPAGQQTLMFEAGPEAQPHLSELIDNGDLLRIQLAGAPVDLDVVAVHSWTVSRLLRIASGNRLSMGQVDAEGQQVFHLPGAGDRETIDVIIEPREPILLADVRS